MQSTPKTNPAYAKQAPTGGFLYDAGDSPHHMIQETSTDAYFEPNPLGGGGAGLGMIAFNFIQHLAALVFTCVVAAYYIPTAGPQEPLNKGTGAAGTYSATVTHTDFVSSWVYIMLVCEILCVVVTVIYYGIVYKALSFPLAGHLGLFFKLCATVNALCLYSFIATETLPEEKEAHVNPGNWAVVTTLYLDLLVVAGYIFNPISGTYQKLVSGKGSKDGDASDPFPKEFKRRAPAA